MFIPTPTIREPQNTKDLVFFFFQLSLSSAFKCRLRKGVVVFTGYSLHLKGDNHALELNTILTPELFFNPLSHKSDRHQISPYNINALENRVVMRIEYMIRDDESN